MKRALLLLAALLVVLAVADTGLRRARRAERDARAVLRPLIDPGLQIVPERVRRLRLLVPGGGDLTYERRGDAWRFPAYFDAWAHADRIESILRLLTGGTGTLVTVDADAQDELAVTPRQGVGFELSGASGPLVTIWVGHSIPGPRGDECYARRADSDTVLHLHGNPAGLIGDGQPPLLDPQLLPRGLARGAVVEARVQRLGGEYRVRRVDAPLAADAPPVPIMGGDRYRWVLEQAGQVDTCVDANVGAWLGALQGARFLRLVDPAEAGHALGSGGRLELLDEAGARDAIRIGGAAASGQVFVANDGAGVVTVMSAAAAALLTPAPVALLDSTRIDSLLPREAP